MQEPALPANESERLQALEMTGLLDSRAEKRFDRITRLAKRLLKTEIVLVSLVDANRQWFKSRQGLDACETGRDISFCGHAILQQEIFEIPNALEDERFADNPLVTGPPNIRFYAGAPLSTADGFNIGTLCIIDSKPRKLTDLERQDLRDLADAVQNEIEANDLRELSQLQKTLVSSVSHELRTPLTSIRGALGLLSGGVAGELSPAAERLVSIAHLNSQRLSELINDLLDLEKLLSGEMVLELQEGNLLDLASSSLDENQLFAEGHGVRLELSGQAKPAFARVDSFRLAQVLTNLLSNAVKYSPQNGVVTLNVYDEGDEVVLSVTDKGPGIPEAFRSRIFQRFAQADSSDAKLKGGTGLGLAISRELVTRMGGTIGFDSVEGQGTTFWCRFPRSTLPRP